MPLWCYKPYMHLSETILLGDAMVRIVLDGDTYRLSYADSVVYENGRRRVQARTSRYDFRSVEQLRYDFERDVEAVGGRLA
jgi:hypothetical protein